MTIEELEAEVSRLGRLATDRRYMLDAYRNMLGPIALKVVAAWDEKGVHRVHYDWGPKAAEMSGEERAQYILDMEAALKDAEPLDFVDSERS